MKYTLKRFLKYWKKQNYKSMYKLTQKTWQHHNTESRLKSIFDNLTLEDWEINEIPSPDNPLKDVKIRVKINDVWNVCNLRMICEKAPYKATLSGNWGINPVSVLKLKRE